MNALGILLFGATIGAAAAWRAARTVERHRHTIAQAAQAARYAGYAALAVLLLVGTLWLAQAH